MLRRCPGGLAARPRPAWPEVRPTACLDSQDRANLPSRTLPDQCVVRRIDGRNQASFWGTFPSKPRRYAEIG